MLTEACDPGTQLNRRRTPLAVWFFFQPARAPTVVELAEGQTKGMAFLVTASLKFEAGEGRKKKKKKGGKGGKGGGGGEGGRGGGGCAGDGGGGGGYVCAWSLDTSCSYF